MRFPQKSQPATWLPAMDNADDEAAGDEAAGDEAAPQETEE